MNVRRRNLFMLIATGSLIACQMPPKTSEEFRKISTDNEGKQVVTVNSPLTQVVSRINAHAKSCNSFRWDKSINDATSYKSGPLARAHDRQLFRWEHENSSHPTFIIVSAGDDVINKQAQGFYEHIIDLQSQGNKTRATLYDLNHPSFKYQFNAEFSKVVQGEPAACQFAKVTANDWKTSNSYRTTTKIDPGQPVDASPGAKAPPVTKPKPEHKTDDSGDME